MKITIESTSEIIQVNGVPARVWEGKTESGIDVFCLVTRIGIDKDADATEFERELKECSEPRMATRLPPLWFID
ncbi:MAG: hypothetical protein HC883_00505 [Bdellovibrionaceae bacterium]|nr:hypothetical protein [Pseudobdellovibrionaceae bacterium]